MITTNVYPTEILAANMVYDTDRAVENNTMETYSNFIGATFYSKAKKDYMAAMFKKQQEALKKTGRQATLTYKQWLRTDAAKKAAKEYKEKVEPKVTAEAKKAAAKGEKPKTSHAVMEFLNSSSGIKSVNAVTNVTAMLTGQSPVGIDEMTVDGGEYNGSGYTPKEKRIIGMKPVTFTLVTVGFLLVAGVTTIIIVRKRMKK